MAKKRRKRDRLLTQAQLEARIRFQPQSRALATLLDEARADRDASIRGEVGAAAGLKQAASDAIPEMRGIYDRAGQARALADRDVAGGFVGLGEAADPHRAVAARESGASARRLAESGADAQRELVDRKVAAEHGRAYGVASIKRQYAGEALKLYRQQQGLAADQGEFTAATYRQLQGDLEKAATEERRLSQADRRIAQADEGLDIRRTEAERAEANRLRDDRRADAKKKGKAKFTPVQLRGARAQWGKGSLYAKELKRRGKLTTANGNAVVRSLVKRGVDEPIARGVVQTYLYGGVRRSQRRVIQRDYGLKPKLRPGRRSGPPVVRKAFPVFYGK